MRVSAEAREIIRRTTAEVFGPAARVRVFGSRADDAARGGDLDLLVELPEAATDRERKIVTLVARLQLRLGDQPIDVLVVDPATRRQPVHDEALRTGVPL
jgi:predicted nucleotidyltransferase